MPRLGQVSSADAHPYARGVYKMVFGERDPVDEPGTASGTPGNWWTVFALVPDAFDHTTAGFQFYRSSNRHLSPRLRELGQTRAGYAVGSQFVFSQHCRMSRVIADGEDSGVNPRVQGLDPAVQHFRKAGVLRYLSHRQAIVKQQLGRTASRQ